MLGAAVAAIAGILLAAALVAFVVQPASWPLLMAAGVLALGVLAERRFRRAADAAPVGPDWRPTLERFVDPETGRELIVWFNPRTGERRYVTA